MLIVNLESRICTDNRKTDQSVVKLQRWLIMILTIKLTRN